MCGCNMWPIYWLVIVFCCCVDCYNVDTINFIRHTREPGSMFGFSVAAHQERQHNWVLVGAPNAQTGQPGVRNGGAVYKCTTTRNDTCEEVLFDRLGDNIDKNGNKIDHKSNQWFGATLQSAGRDGPIVACAPRYVWFTIKRERRDPVGTCYIARNDFTDIKEYSPCRTLREWGYHRQGSCQAGFSATLSKDGKRLFMGAPGSWYWQGQMYSIDANAYFPVLSTDKYGAIGSGQVIQQSLEKRPAEIRTREGSALDDDSYMGYSTTIGNFANEAMQGSAVGMPRGAGLIGKVVLFTWNLTNFRNITGEQLGSYFGYSVATSDIDGDKLDDLIIGAPLYTEPNNEGKYEVGRVYVVYQNSSEGSYRRLHTLDGINSKSRFGLSLAALGDINLDGYGDFAVGAPYDGPNERGAVYIFHGSKDGVRKKFSQVIHSEEVSGLWGPPINTFGFSLAGGVDLDSNDYPDTVVGAYLSSTVFFFRSRPVVKVVASANFMIAKKEIVLEQKNCSLNNGHRVACTTLDTCFNFHGVGVPRDVVLELQYVLDTKKPTNPRMYFIDSPNHNVVNETINLRKDDRPICRQKVIYIKNDIRDKLTALEAEVRYSMKQRRSVGQGAYSKELLPILDLTTPPVKKDSISVHKNCGTDHICIPDLKLMIHPNVQRYLLGSQEKLEFDVIIENSGEDSFETIFDTQLPDDVDFIKVVEVDKNGVRVLCSDDFNRTITCEVGNPLPKQKIAHFRMLFQPHHKEGMKSSYDFNMFVNSTNPEENSTMADNKFFLKMPIWIDSKLELSGTSRPTEVHYNTSYYTSSTIKRESDIGPQVIHLYTIRNNGPSSIKEAEMLFIWPYATEGGDDLMYLLEQPHTIGNVKCEAADANYKGYQLDYRKKTIWETLDIDVIRSESAASVFGGVVIDEGIVTSGTADKVDKISKKDEIDFEKSTGDASYIHILRQQEQDKTDSDSKSVLVTQDTGRGSGVHTVKHTSWNSSGPVTTHTYSKNTTIIRGPDGRIVKTETVTTNNGDVISGSSEAHGHSQDGGKRVQIDVKPHIIYTSSGSQDAQEAGKKIQEEVGMSSTHVGASGGQDFSITGQYSNREQETRPTQGHKHFDWNGGGSHQQVDTNYQGVRTDDERYQDTRQSKSGHGGSYEDIQRGRGTHQQGGYEGNADYNVHGNAYSSEEITAEDLPRSYLGEPQPGYNRSHNADWSTQRGYEGQNGQRVSGGGHRDPSTYGKYNASWEEDFARHGIGAAAIGHGLKTTTLNLGTLGSNVDESVSGQARTNLETHVSEGANKNTQGRYDPDLREIVYDSQERRGGGLAHGSRTYTAGRYGSGEAGARSGESRWQAHSETQWSSEGGSATHHSQEVGRDNVPTDRPDLNKHYIGRRRRQINTNDIDIKNVMQCKATKCKVVKCTVGPMTKGQDAYVALRSRINVHTLRNISSSQPISFSSMMLARISRVPYIGDSVQKDIYSHEIFTTVSAPETDTKPDVVPLWVVILSAVAGAIILLLLIFLMYKCGFFKRNRPSDAPERQPLNRNGHYNSGDEAL